jgi:hypothetical protein
MTMTKQCLVTTSSRRITIDFSAHFVLIGNTQNGGFRMDVVEFTDFEDLKRNLQNKIIRMRPTGEWRLDLYEVSPYYAVQVKKGLKVPTLSKRVFSHTYQDFDIKCIHFFEDKMQKVSIDLEERFLNDAYGTSEFYIQLRVEDLCF